MNTRSPTPRPNWTDYFLGLAKAVSRRTNDSQTGHGCVIANERNQILGVGYNGLPHGMKEDYLLPTLRPEKYPWMIHAEKNALANAPGGVEGATAFVTGPPCFSCLIHLWQHGVKRVVYHDSYGYQGDSDPVELANKRLFLEQSSMEVVAVKPDLSWLVDLVLEDEGLHRNLTERVTVVLNDPEFLEYCETTLRPFGPEAQ